MWIRDDGRGMPEREVEPRTTGSGLGLDSMHARAQQIGAEIRWKAAEPTGTEVEVRFRPGAADRRVAS